MTLIPPAARRLTLVGGLVVGALDILAVMTLITLRGGEVERMLRGIASALIGPAAADGGWPIALLGLGLHMAIAMVIVAVFVAVALRWRMLSERWVPAGIAYGVWVYFFMQFVVVANSRANWSPPEPEAMVRGLIIHMLFVGLPTAWFARQAVSAAGRLNKA
jgi:hypothetical protein